MTDGGRLVGVVPVEGRGSLPFALLRGEPLVALASWALEDAGVVLCDYNTPWSAVRAEGGGLVVHDPLCPATPVDFLVECIEESASSGQVVAGVRPVTDTVKLMADDRRIGETVDRAGLVAVASPLVLPAAVVDALSDWPDLDDLSALVDRLRASSSAWDGVSPPEGGVRLQEPRVRFREAPASARRIADESDLALLEALQ